MGNAVIHSYMFYQLEQEKIKQRKMNQYIVTEKKNNTEKKSTSTLLKEEKTINKKIDF